MSYKREPNSITQYESFCAGQVWGRGCLFLIPLTRISAPVFMNDSLQPSKELHFSEAHANLVL